MKNEVQKALNNIRPYLQADNGDVELVEVSEDGIVKLDLPVLVKFVLYLF